MSTNACFQRASRRSPIGGSEVGAGDGAETAFEDIHEERVADSLTMFDRMIFKGHLTRLFGEGAVRAFLWSQGVPITEFTDYAKRTTAEIARAVERVARDADRPVISFDHVKTRATCTSPSQACACASTTVAGITGSACFRTHPVRPTLQSLQDGRDTVLEAAVRILNEGRVL